ncbi:MAG TPA: hypothetical protein VHO03_16930 [Ignavibacteriales bacterium]|nr:hypothetical protein [Ignavibacteriales bacterium]
MALTVLKEDFTQLIERFKATLRYYQGRMCSCVGENNGLPRLDCGCTLGYWYNEPETLIGIRHDISHRYTNSPQGQIFEGGAQFIIPRRYKGTEQNAFYNLNKGDVISVEGKVRRDRDILRKGVRDRLYAFEVKKIISVGVLDKVFVEGRDYSLVNNEIVWTGDCPSEGTYYTVEFLCQQQYMIWDAGLKDRGTDTKELPRSIVGILRRYAEAVSTNPIDNVNVDQNLNF